MERNKLMKTGLLTKALLISLASTSMVCLARDGQGHGSEIHQDGDKQPTESHIEWAHGEVRRINKALGKITLRHGFLKSIDMPPMTMVFTMRDPSALDTLNVGDPVEFTVTKNSEGQLIVTDIRAKETSERPVP